LRKTGIDELPQLFNVLFGSMSIVGPRPELPKFVEAYSKTVPLYNVKHQVKPGITGLAQIYGYRGDTSIERRIELDIKYIETWSVYNDLKIIITTPFKMFNRNEKYVK
jgi:lipopolysaccharide/colanic/teichoic acid biosynthesis glycosyltransferase